MAFVLQIIGTNRNLVKFAQFSQFLFFKYELSPLLCGKILPVDLTAKSQMCLFVPPEEIITPKDNNLIKELEQATFLRKQDVVKLAEKIKKINSLSYVQSLKFLRSCDRITLYEPPNVRIQLTDLIWKNLKQSGVEFDIFHYNLLLSMYLQNEHHFSCKDFLSELESKGISPNAVTYRRLLRASCQQGKIEEATFFLEKIQENGIPVNEYVFDSLILGYCQIDDIESALGVLNLMKKKKLEPNTESYSSLLCFYARKGKIDELKNMLFECENNEVMITDHHYLEVIYNLVLAGNKKFINVLLDKILRTPKFFSARINIINRLINKKLDKEAIIVYKKLFRDDEKVNYLVFKHFFLEYCLEVRSLEEVVNLCQLLVPEGTFNFVISAALKKIIKNRSLETCREFLLLIDKINFPIRNQYFWPLIINASESGNYNILRVLQIMSELKVVPNLGTTGVVVRCYDFTNTETDDIGLLEDLGLNGIYLSSKILTKLLEEKQYEKAKLISCFRRINYKITLLTRFVNSENVSHIAEMLYHFLHDVYLESFSKSESDDSKIINHCLTAIHEFIGYIFASHRNLMIPFLKAISEQPVYISNRSLLLLQEYFHKIPEVINLANGLSSTARKNNFVLHKNILRLKQFRTLVSHDLQNAIQEKNLSEAEKCFKELEKDTTISDVLALMAFYVKMNKPEKVEALVGALKTANQDKYPTLQLIIKKKFVNLINDLISLGNERVLTKVAKEGRKLNLFRYDSLEYLKIKFYIERNEIEKAVDLYCKNKNKTEKEFESIVNSLFSLHPNSDLLEKVINSTVEILGKKKTLPLVFFGYVSNGCLKEATRILDFNSIRIPAQTLEKYCIEFSNKKNEKALLTLLEIYDEYGETVVRYLMDLYEKENKFEEIEKLWLQVQEKNIILNDRLFKTMAQYVNKKEKDVESNEEDEMENSDPADVEFEVSSALNFDDEEYQHYSKETYYLKLIEEGNFKEILSHLTREKIKKIARACKELINQNRITEYLTVVEKVIQKRPDALSLLIIQETTNLNSSDLNKVMNLTITALQMGRNTALKKLLEFGLAKPSLLEKLSPELNRLLNLNMCSDLIDHDSLNVKNFFRNPNSSPLSRSLVYSMIIQSENKKHTATALKYLEKAINENLGKHLHQKTVKLLKNQLKPQAVQVAKPS